MGWHFLFVYGTPHPVNTMESRINTETESRAIIIQQAGHG